MTKSFKTVLALDRVSFSVNRGEIVGLLGPNGAGKTTAILTILGLLLPTSGRVEIFGSSPFDQPYDVLKRLNFSSAYVFLPYNLKVIQNLKTYARLYNVKDAGQKIGGLLELFEISHLANRQTGYLSSGEMTRLNLCKSMLNDPEILLLDEPTASLDPDMSDKVRRIIRKIQKDRGMAILTTSHNMREVEEVCDRILFIHKGKKITEGVPAEVLNRFHSRSLEELFLKIARGGDLISAEGGS